MILKMLTVLKIFIALFSVFVSRAHFEQCFHNFSQLCNLMEGSLASQRPHPWKTVLKFWETLDPVKHPVRKYRNLDRNFTNYSLFLNL